MPRKRPPRSATVLLLLIALHLTGPYDVAARFRGAGHKPIPTVGDDGAVRSTGAERASELAAATSGGGRKKTVKRTKTGLVPWWVRKRLQEQAEPDQKASSDVQQQPEKAKRKKMPNVVEVLQLEPYERELEVARPIKSAAILVEDIPLKAGSLEAEKVANLQNELQKLNDAAHQEQLQRGTAAEAGLVSRAAELQDELSSLGDAAAEEGYGGSAQIDLLRTEGHDSTEGEMSLIDEAAQRVAGRAAEQQAGANGRAKKGARQAAKAKGGAKKMKKSTAIQQAAAQAAANAQKASRKQKDAQARSNLVEDADTDDYDEW